MGRRSCDGRGLLAAFRGAAAALDAHAEEVDALNVFPVPDGDTGGNMVATVMAAVAQADRLDQPADAGRVADAISFGALMGSRGNSGVITSQILRGMAVVLGGRSRFGGAELAAALTEGANAAYRAVARPVEGTILTVIREAAEAAVRCAEDGGDVQAVLRAAVDEAEAGEEAVETTPATDAEPTPAELAETDTAVEELPASADQADPAAESAKSAVEKSRASKFRSIRNKLAEAQPEDEDLSYETYVDGTDPAPTPVVAAADEPGSLADATHTAADTEPEAAERS